MKKISRRNFLIAAGALTAAGALAGCSSSSSNAASVASSAPAMSESTTSEEAVLTVTGGKIQGVTDENGVTAYLGIPYAASTAGENRWKEPQPVSSWEETKLCNAYGPMAPQSKAVNWTGSYTEEYLVPGDVYTGEMSEDCLNLNVWTNGQKGDQKPVIVYIHGGGNNSGANRCEIYNGSSIARQDVVFVSINYRVGIFGFLAYKDGSGDEVTGNYALMDQIAALKWVQENIAEFGGDPQNVTIMGQSAGSRNCQSLIISPAASGLFNKAVCLSAYNLEAAVPTLTELQSDTANKMDGTTLAELRNMSTVELQEFAESVYNPTKVCLDGKILSKDYLDSYLSGEYNPVDMLAGCVDGDGGMYPILNLPDDDGIPMTPVTTATVEAYKQALPASFGDLSQDFSVVYPIDETAEDVYPTAAQINIDGLIANYYCLGIVNDSNQLGCRAYIHYFSHSIPDSENELGQYGAFHTADVSYWLDYYATVSNKKWSEYDYQLGKTMSGYLVNFARTGDPNGNDIEGNALPTWSSIDPNADITYIHFSDTAIQPETMDTEKSNLWKEYKEQVLGVTL